MKIYLLYHKHTTWMVEITSNDIRRRGLVSHLNKPSPKTKDLEFKMRSKGLMNHDVVVSYHNS